MKLIFCSTTGRSGTKWLSFILSKELKAVVEHEGVPKMVELRNGKKSASFDEIKKWWRYEKLPYIKKISGDLPYIDTGHLINKGFLEPLIDLGIIPDLIVLRRDYRAVAKSLLKLNTIPFRTEKGRRFCCNEYDKLYFPLPLYQNLSDYQLCYWYCLECQIRAIANKKRIIEAGGKICEIDFNEMFKEGYAPSVISSSFGIPEKNKFEKLMASFELFFSSEKEKSKNKKEILKQDQAELNINYDREEIEILYSIKDMKSD